MNLKEILILWKSQVCFWEGMHISLAGGDSMKWFSDMVINFVIRMLICMALVFLINQFLAEKEIDICVGINPVTAMTTGTLGVPGVCLLYGIVWYQGF